VTFIEEDVSFLFGNVNVLKKQQRNLDVQTSQKGIQKAAPGKEGAAFWIFLIRIIKNVMI